MLPTQYRCNEAVQLLFDPRQTSYEALCEVLWRRIDPTLRNQVGLDRGATYRHALYAHTAEQLVQATASVEARQLALAPATVGQHGQGAAFPCLSLPPGPPGTHGAGPGLLHALRWRASATTQAPVVAHDAAVSARQSRRVPLPVHCLSRCGRACRLRSSSTWPSRGTSDT